MNEFTEVIISDAHFASDYVGLSIEDVIIKNDPVKTKSIVISCVEDHNEACVMLSKQGTQQLIDNLQKALEEIND